LHAGRIVDGGWWLVIRMAIDRCRTDLDQRPPDNGWVVRGAGNAVKTAQKEYGCADAGNDPKRANRRQKSHQDSDTSERPDYKR